MKRIYLVGGPGGVGKTTLAAALGIRLAREGHRTIVLTVDPARRLAQALGFHGFAEDIQKVPLADGELYATMLDTQRDFDRIISRFAKDESQRERIFKHPLYRAATSSMGGTHEYAAMERLLEFAQNKNYDRIVVDTPPTQNAVDLLNAPVRLANFMDHSILKWFQGSSPGYLKWFSRSGKLALKLLEKIFGSDFLSKLSEFMEELHGMHEGFKERNQEVTRLLQSEETAFLLVTFPSEVRFQESESFFRELQKRQIPLERVLLNRVEPKPPRGAEPPENLRPLLEYTEKLRDAQEHWISLFQTHFSETEMDIIERWDQELHDIGALSQLGQMLVL